MSGSEELPRLEPGSGLADVAAYLRRLVEELKAADAITKATAREAALRDLAAVEAVSAPARLVDSALGNGAAPDSPDALHGGALALADPEPWPTAVDGAALLEEIAATFTRYVAMPTGADAALALWTVHAHAHAAASISPVLAITSPEKRCGKTTLLELLSALVPRPLPASNLTPATVFRAVEKWSPTLLVDEADTFLTENVELRGVLNSGHRRSLAFVVRSVGDDFEPRRFATWAPKAVALIGRLPDTLADRSIEIRMRRRTAEEHVERLRLDRLGDLEPLRRRAWTWARHNVQQLEVADPELPEGLHDRARDNWRPLTAIADLAGGAWPRRARMAARVLSGDVEDEESLGVRLLADVRRVLEGYRGDRIRSRELVDRLVALEEAPWSEYKGRGLSTHSLANFLRPFSISSAKHRFADGAFNGYQLAEFEEAWRRYLTHPPPGDHPVELEHPEHPSRGAAEGLFTKWNIGGDVPLAESGEKPGSARVVPHVPVREGGAPGDGGCQEELHVPAPPEREAEP